MADKDKPLDDDRLAGLVGVMVRDSEQYRDERSTARVKATKYLDGDVPDLPKTEGRSQVVSRDVRGAVKKVLPSLVRTILGNDQIVEYQPVGQGDEESAEQATDFVNFITLPECDGRQEIEDAIHDALRTRNGILKWWHDTRIDVSYSSHSGLSDDAFPTLVNEKDTEVLEHTERVEDVEGEQVKVHDLRIRRQVRKSVIKIACIPQENWLIHPDATKLEDSPIVGENFRIRRSELVEMGYDRDVIAELPEASASTTEQDDERDTLRRDAENRTDELSHAMQEIEYYDLLVRIDADGDGIAELRRIVFAGGLKADNILENVEWDEVNYADIVTERRPHQAD